jgi:hypothetical protein
LLAHAAYNQHTTHTHTHTHTARAINADATVDGEQGEYDGADDLGGQLLDDLGQYNHLSHVDGPTARVDAHIVGSASAQRYPNDYDGASAVGGGLAGDSNDPLNGDEEYAEPEFEGMWGDGGSNDDAQGTTLTGSASTRRSAAVRKSRSGSSGVGGGGSIGDGGGGGSNMIKPVGRGPPSKLELRLMEEARDRQRAGIVREQVVQGRTFKGAGFASDPEVIRFENFEPGQVYRMTLTLTNVSLTLNNFKVRLLQLCMAVVEHPAFVFVCFSLFGLVCLFVCHFAL